MFYFLSKKDSVLAVILTKIFVKKRRKIGDLIYNHGLTKLRFGANLFFVKIYYAITACTTYTFFIFGKGRLKEKW